MPHAAARAVVAIAVCAGPVLVSFASPASAQLPPIGAECSELLDPLLDPACDLIEEVETVLEPVTEPVTEEAPLPPEVVAVLEVIQEVLGSVPLPLPLPTEITPPAEEPAETGAPAVVTPGSQPARSTSAASTTSGSSGAAATAASATPTVPLRGGEAATRRARYVAPSAPATPTPELAAPAPAATAELVLDTVLPPFDPRPGNAPSILVPGLIAAILAMGVGEGLRRTHLAGHRIWL